jgi:hypothetical protein
MLNSGSNVKKKRSLLPAMLLSALKKVSSSISTGKPKPTFVSHNAAGNSLDSKLKPFN